MTETKQITTRKQLGDYMRDMANLMGLRDWMLYLGHDEPDNPNAAASCYIEHRQNEAIVRFCKDWPSLSPQQLRRYVVHELLHCHFHALWYPVEHASSHLPPGVAYMLNEGFQDAREITLDNIARSWAEHLPLPVKASKPKKEKVAA